MPFYEVEYYQTRRGSERVEALDKEAAEEIINNMSETDLIWHRSDWEVETWEVK